MSTLYWFQCGSCGGDTWSLFNAESPDIIEFLDSMDIELLWHPYISIDKKNGFQKLNESIISEERPLDILCIEGSIIMGPSGTGMYDFFQGTAKKNIVNSLIQKAKYVVAVGTCASFGGIGSGKEIEASGLQFLQNEIGGFLGKNFKSKKGVPVINLPGCPCHCDIIIGILSSLASDNLPELGIYNTPVDWYNMMVHQGCTRNEYHEYRVEEKKFGQKGCLFFHMGCHGPLAMGPCNKVLWNRRSSKTRVGVPCFGCTRPDFPQKYAFFETRNIEGIPLELPDGVDRAHYLAYKGMAAAAAPVRLKKRNTNI